MKIFIKLWLWCILGVTSVSAQLLNDAFIEPDFFGQPNTEFSGWDVFYSPLNGVNFPDVDAPNGTFQSASDAGFSPPSDAAPGNPFAFWNNDNPTIQQTVQGNAFIISPGIAGNIYSFGPTTGYEMNDTAPFDVGTVVAQFQTAGSLPDFDSIRLVYSDPVNGTIELAPDNVIREFSGTGSPFGGILLRYAAQWNLTGLNISTYQIKFNSQTSNMSHQQFFLDTAITYSEEIPSQRDWDNEGTGNLWSIVENWSNNELPSDGGNIEFATGNGVTLDSDQAVGEIFLDAAGTFTIAAQSSEVLTVNTGITANPSSTAVQTIETPVVMGGIHLYDIGSNAEVTLSGTVSENLGSWGFNKFGDGLLRFTGDNTFTGGVSLSSGTLIMSGANLYAAETVVSSGMLVVESDVLTFVPGPLGNAASNIFIQSGGALGIETLDPTSTLLADGEIQFSRGITIASGDAEKTIAAQNTGTGTVFSGTIGLDFFDGSVTLSSLDFADHMTFSGNINGGSDSNVLTKKGAGTVHFSGNSKDYSNSTVVMSGTLSTEVGTDLTGGNSVTVYEGATLNADGNIILSSSELIVNGTLGGSGDIELDQVQVIGSGTLTKSLTFDNNDSVTPGNNIGAMSFTGDQVWGGNASYFWEINDTSGAAGDAIGWDLVNISGTLDITATSINPFTVNVASLDIFTSSTGDVYNLNNFQSYSWVIASAGSITNFSVDKFVVNTAGLSNTVNGTFAIAQQGNNLVLTYTAVDIPSLTYDTFTFNLPFNERGELDDPDGDGVENIIEFALGRDGGSIVGEGAVAEANIDETIPDSREFSISFRLPDPVREQLVYEVSVSETLAPDSWALIAIKNGVAPWQGPATVVTTAPIGGFVTVTVQDIVPVGPNGKRFLKFDVSASQDGPQ